MSALLQTRALHKHFGGLSAVADVNLEIAAGEIHCLIGPNGAGKSTLFKLVAGRGQPHCPGRFLAAAGSARAGSSAGRARRT